MPPTSTGIDLGAPTANSEQAMVDMHVGLRQRGGGPFRAAREKRASAAAPNRNRAGVARSVASAGLGVASSGGASSHAGTVMYTVSSYVQVV